MITKITKSFRRVYSDNSYGSIAAGTEITVEQEINSPEEFKKVSKQLINDVVLETNNDLKKYLELKEQQKVL